MSRAPSCHRRAAGRGPIEASAVYPLATFVKRLGIGRASLTALRRRGLPVRSIGRKLYIDGTEALETLRRLWREDAQRIDSPPDGPGNPERLEGTIP